jgi:hypothetical protein
VAELSIAELVHLQANHLYLAARLEEVDHVLLGCLDRDVTNPEGVAVCRLHALRLVAPAVWSLRITLFSRLHLIHVREIELDLRIHEGLTCFGHCRVYACSVLELHVREVAPHVTFAYTDLCYGPTLFEKLCDGLLFWLSVQPANPNGSATLGLRSLRLPNSCRIIVPLL